MFESAEIGHRLDKQTYEDALPALRSDLLEAQYELRRLGKFSVIILINGIEGAGKGETVKLLTEWMDPRLIQVETFDIKTEEESVRPPAWRYWRRLPPKGRIGVFFGNWYSQMLQNRVHGVIKNAELDHAVEQALALEQMLCNEGTLILKFWFHLSKDQMNARLKTLKDDPLHSWRLSPLDWQQSKTYARFVKYGEHVLRATNREHAPWHVIEGVDERFRSMTFATLLLNSLRTALQQIEQRAPEPHPAALPIPSLDGRSLLSSLDLTRALEKDHYKRQLPEEQARLSRLMRHKRMKDHALVALFEGNDAAGKGSTIRRVAGALDPRQYRIVPIGAPTQEEREQPYLWRFWRHVPAHGKFTVFDRSWYGRVLVERVEGLCSVGDWFRAYEEINDFEEQLHESGIVVVKFWMAIDQSTQLERFKERASTPFKQFKITDEDWRNRERWDDYVEAVNDMVDRTSTSIAPWTLVEANDKRFARVKVLRTLNDALEHALTGEAS
jgi:polyphosphate:AMP phosphotransferase